MDTADLHPLVEDLSNDIDDLEQSLAPLLKTALSHSTSKLPLLDKAKVYVLATYAIESILFSSLRLSGVDAKNHPVFQELTRVKQYFGKIKTAEGTGEKRPTTVDKETANRFIRHGLAGNERYDRERAERVRREKGGAKRKREDIAVGKHTRFDPSATRINDAAAGESSGVSDADLAAHGKPSKNKRKFDEASGNDSESQSHARDLEASADEEFDVTTSTLKVPKSSKEALDSLLDNQPKAKKKRMSKGPKMEDRRADEMK